VCPEAQARILASLFRERVEAKKYEKPSLFSGDGGVEIE